jgi:hypothetical protein
VEKQPVVGPQHAEELAEHPGPLGVDLQRALAIGQPGDPHEPVLEAAHRTASPEHGAGPAELERLAGGQRIAQVVAVVKNEEERQRGGGDGHQRVAPARARDVRELVDDAGRVAGGSVGWGRVGHEQSGVGCGA